MKIMAATGIFFMALDCLEQAMGWQPQTLFTPDYIWLWWIPTAIWFLAGIQLLFFKKIVNAK